MFKAQKHRMRLVVAGVVLGTCIAYEAIALTTCNDTINGANCNYVENINRTCCNNGSMPVYEQTCTVKKYDKPYDGLYWNTASACFNPTTPCSPFNKTCD